ncbi:MAG: MoxR family ATPase [Chloroflexi bacterium]|nr:MoxR family ATPase [Chloroflexota bacterium]
MPPLQATAVPELADRLAANIQRAVVAREQVLKLAIVGLLAEGHVLLQDVPGVGKTLLSKTLARSVDASFSRIQFTPDMLPADITGSSIFNQKLAEFRFVPGPIFANIVLADEINRATPRTQAAMLEAMGERQVTTEGVTHRLPRPFFVIATENPVETYGTFPLPEAELDRFLLCFSMGYPEIDEEIGILDREEHEPPTVDTVLTTEDVQALQRAVRAVNVSRPVKEYIIRIVAATRQHPEIALGVSSRGAVAVQRAAQAWAAMVGRPFVVPDDVKGIAPAALAHRLVLHSPGADRAVGLVNELLESVAVPL